LLFCIKFLKVVNFIYDFPCPQVYCAVHIMPICSRILVTWSLRLRELLSVWKEYAEENVRTWKGGWEE
jgi:sugar-specific transcriptional regulator TrmB